MLIALIVEDEFALHTLYGRILNNAGYDVVSAEDGDIAIDILEKGLLPSVIMLDIRLPHRNGLEVLKYLQDFPGIENIHVIIVSASGSYKEYTKMLPSAEFMLKPVLPTQLQEVLNALEA